MALLTDEEAAEMADCAAICAQTEIQEQLDCGISQPPEDHPEAIAITERMKSACMDYIRLAEGYRESLADAAENLKDIWGERHADIPPGQARGSLDMAFDRLSRAIDRSA